MRACATLLLPLLALLPALPADAAPPSCAVVGHLCVEGHGCVGLFGDPYGPHPYSGVAACGLPRQCGLSAAGRWLGPCVPPLP